MKKIHPFAMSFPKRVYSIDILLVTYIIYYITNNKFTQVLIKKNE